MCVVQRERSLNVHNCSRKFEIVADRAEGRMSSSHMRILPCMDSLHGFVPWRALSLAVGHFVKLPA
jgi:hypothetical protein